MSKPRWLLELEPARPTDRPDRMLALALKRLLRSCGMRCVSIRPVDVADDASDQEGSVSDER